MLPHPVAVAADVDDVAVVQEAVDQPGGHHLVAEHTAPFLEALVRSEHRRGTLVAGVDELEEQDRALLGHRQVADLADPRRLTDTASSNSSNSPNRRTVRARTDAPPNAVRSRSVNSNSTFGGRILRFFKTSPAK